MNYIDFINEQGVILRAKDHCNPFEQAKAARSVVREALKMGRRTAYFSLLDFPKKYETEEIWTEYVKRTGRDISMREFKIEKPDCTEDQKIVQERMTSTDKDGNPLLSVVEAKAEDINYSIVKDIQEKARAGFSLIVIIGDGLQDNYHLNEFFEITRTHGITIVIFD